MVIKRAAAVVLLLGSALASPAMARNILITNDDALSGNVVALYEALKAEGHDVIVAVPCRGQSGKGASLPIMEPVVTLDSPCRDDVAATGAPGAGPMTKAAFANGDFHYFDATPIAASLYGLSLAEDRWNAMPDLVLSGPNEGKNVGPFSIFSGTLGAASNTALHGIPTIGLSADMSTTSSPDAPSPNSRAVASRTVELVAALEKRSGGGSLLPARILLNVNFPREAADAEFRLSKVGTHTDYRPRFSASMAEEMGPEMVARAEAMGHSIPDAPGILVSVAPSPPAPGEENDEAIVSRTAISISPMRPGYGNDLDYGPWLSDWLAGILP